MQDFRDGEKLKNQKNPQKTTKKTEEIRDAEKEKT